MMGGIEMSMGPNFTSSGIPLWDSGRHLWSEVAGVGVLAGAVIFSRQINGSTPDGKRILFPIRSDA